MTPEAVIFDMDGLLIDSEPLWNEAGKEVLLRFGKKLSDAQYEQTTGLRTFEWLQYWFDVFQIDPGEITNAEHDIIELVTQKIMQRGNILPGVNHIIGFFHKKGIRMAIATSSPAALANQVINKLGIEPYIVHVSSAQHLSLGKPHPQVYLNCAQYLGVTPVNCLCFEDSFNGVIAAKAARMKCVAVPAHGAVNQAKWGAADLKISSLQNFNDLLLMQL